MSSMEYDLDSMGGLMPQIFAITAPPGSRDRPQNGQNKEGLAAHPYFRRPGRGHNRDTCDSCKEGGDLICCDVCPASFHLECHDPPLDESNLPSGRWFCHQCRMAEGEDDSTSISSGKSNRSASAKGVKRKEEMDKGASCSTSSERKFRAGGREFEISETPLATLIKAAASINPQQFSLPYELTVPVCFPGEPKVVPKGNGCRRNHAKKKAHELDCGLVPLPAKLCFQCTKSCRVGPLIPCDYCSLYFHLDCLDPPLTVPPMGRWMCPNHPEHFMDSYILKTASLSERVRLWDKFVAPVDQDAVKLSFMQRCHRKNPPFRYKVKRALRSRVRVPDSVKLQYDSPAELLPRYSPYIHQLITSNEEEVNLVKGFTSLQAKEERQEGKLGVEDRPTKQEKDDWLVSVLQMQSSIMKHMTGDSKGGGSAGGDLCSPDRPTCMNGDVTGHDVRRAEGHKENFELFGVKKAAIKAGKVKPTGKRPSKMSTTDMLAETLDSLAASLQESIIGKQGVTLNDLQYSVVEVLALQRLQQITECGDTNENSVVKTSPLPARALLCPLAPDITLKEWRTPGANGRRTEPVPMTYRVLRIGAGSNNDVDLNTFGHCNYISSDHAAIFFDENTGHYELLNYSAHGTRVNGVVYHYDRSEKTVTHAPPPFLTQQVRSIIDSRRGVTKNTKESPQKPMTDAPDQTLINCDCKRSNWKNINCKVPSGWEGGAVLHHGSHIRFGCLQFVFSVMEDASQLDWIGMTLSTYDRFITQNEVEVKQEPQIMKQETELSAVT